MPRQRNPKRDLAYRLWLESDKKKKLKDIAAELEVSESQIRKWKNQDNWNGNVTNQRKSNVTKRKRGGQPGNKNAVGGNQSAPLRNKNAEKFGFFRKYLPEETVSIIEEMPKDPLDVLWDQIQIAYAAIIRAQSIMYVRDQDDRTKQVTMKGESADAFNVQEAWDKQSNFLQAQARAQKSLEGLVKQYDNMLRERGELATEEQRARIEQIKARTEQLKGSEQNQTEDKIRKLFEAIGGALDESE